MGKIGKHIREEEPKGDVEPEEAIPDFVALF
jgi:hypothetical protein